MIHIYKNSRFGQNWFTYPALYKKVVREFPSGSTFVEVGSWKGKSSAFMAVEIANSNKDIKFYCVDHWLGSIEHNDKDHPAYEPNIDTLYDTFISNMQPLEKYYQPIKMASIDAATLFEDGSLDFVFLDASHEYNDICADIECWKPKVKVGGILAGHDYFNDGQFKGVKKAVDEKIKKFNVSEFCWIHRV